MALIPTPDLDDVPSLAEHQRLQEEIVAEGGNPIEDIETMQLANEVTPAHLKIRCHRSFRTTTQSQPERL